MLKSTVTCLLFIVTLFATHVGFAQDQKAVDDKILKDYLAKNHIKAKRTSTGLYYIITTPGAGSKAKPGQKVTMNYVGKFLDGKRFDGNVDDNFKPSNGRQPLTFTLGVGQVIKGWDEGVQFFNEGARGAIYIPSGLAYGPNAHGPVPANSILMFDLELLSAK